VDISETLAPKSDQLNADDLMLGPITVTVDHTVVTQGGEQPVAIHLVERPGHPYKPSKGMRRIISQAWGPESDAYVGKRMTLFRNPAVKWAGKPAGGIQISHLSHIDEPLQSTVTESKTQRNPFTVQPLTETAPVKTAASKPLPEPSAERVAATNDVTMLNRMWEVSGLERRAQIEARVFELDTTTQGTLDEGGAE